MNGPILFTQRIDFAIAGKEPMQQLDIIAAMIADAEADKEEGYGPPQSDITSARRRWLDIYDSIYTERVPV